MALESIKYSDAATTISAVRDGVTLYIPVELVILTTTLL
jgi:hypothetical protein